MLYYAEGALQFYNTFSFTTAEDLIYYVMFVMEQLSLNSEKIEIDLYGEVEEDSNIYDLLSQYIRNVKFGDRSELTKYTDILDVVPKHFYFNLFQQYMCV